MLFCPLFDLTVQNLCGNLPKLECTGWKATPACLQKFLASDLMASKAITQSWYKTRFSREPMSQENTAQANKPVHAGLRPWRLPAVKPVPALQTLAADLHSAMLRSESTLTALLSAANNVYATYFPRQLYGRGFSFSSYYNFYFTFYFAYATPSCAVRRSSPG